MVKMSNKNSQDCGNNDLSGDSVGHECQSPSDSLGNDVNSTNSPKTIKRFILNTFIIGMLILLGVMIYYYNSSEYKNNNIYICSRELYLLISNMSIGDNSHRYNKSINKYLLNNYNYEIEYNRIMSKLDDLKCISLIKIEGKKRNCSSTRIFAIYSKETRHTFVFFSDGHYQSFDAKNFDYSYSLDYLLSEDGKVKNVDEY